MVLDRAMQFSKIGRHALAGAKRQKGQNLEIKALKTE
jgi:hypothetical protein